MVHPPSSDRACTSGSVGPHCVIASVGFFAANNFRTLERGSGTRDTASTSSMRSAMFPAICRGRALDSCLLAAAMASVACASTGSGMPLSLAPGVMPAAAQTAASRVSPSVLAAVLLIENAPFDTSAVSTEGAIGLMQVMPMHVGSYRCLSGDLLNVEANICHGARLLHSHLRRTKSMDVALRRYNGCVRGRNTPRCQNYPVRVLRTASRLRREILVAGYEPTDAERSRGASSLLSDLPPDVEADSQGGAA